MSSYVYINSALRDVYKYRNPADFLIEGKQTETWNLIRSATPSLPQQRSQNQYYSVKCCSLSLPMTPEILQYPGVFVVLESSTAAFKNCSRINHMSQLDCSGFPCDAARTLQSIADSLGVNVGDLTPQQIMGARKDDAKMFYQDTKCLKEAAWWMVCDKLQFNEKGEAMWIQYKSCMEQIMPLNWRGNDIRFKVLDPFGKVLQLGNLLPPFGRCPVIDPCEGCIPIESELEALSSSTPFVTQFGGIFDPPIDVTLSYKELKGYVSLQFPLVNVASNNAWSPIVSLTPLPTSLRPAQSLTFSAQIIYDGKVGPGSITIGADGIITIQRPPIREGDDSGSYGWMATEVTWCANGNEPAVGVCSQVYALLEVTYLPHTPSKTPPHFQSPLSYEKDV